MPKKQVPRQTAEQHRTATLLESSDTAPEDNETLANIIEKKRKQKNNNAPLESKQQKTKQRYDEAETRRIVVPESENELFTTHNMPNPGPGQVRL